MLKDLCSKPPPTAHVKREFLRMAMLLLEMPQTSVLPPPSDEESHTQWRGAPSTLCCAQRHNETLYWWLCGWLACSLTF